MPKTRIVVSFGNRTIQADAPEDATLEFVAESAIAGARRSTSRTTRRTRLAGVVTLMAALGGAVYGSAALKGSAVPQNGSLKIETDPAGAEVRVDGTVRGVSPLALSMA